MGRSIVEIKAEIGSAFISQEVVRSMYGLDDNATFEDRFKPVSIEGLLFYAVASCIWILEQLFDKHTEEVEKAIQSLRPHTLRWYVTKTLEYMHKGKLVMSDGVVVADHYDTSGMTASEIDAAKVVKYAVATETNTQVFIKVAKNDPNKRPTQLHPAELSGLEYYLSQIKDAGVAIKVLNEPADRMNVELVVLYDPSLLSVAYPAADSDQTLREVQLASIDGGDDVISAAVQSVISNLPFNGEYRNSDLMAAIQSIKGVEVADIVKVETCANGSNDFALVVGYQRPYSGYYRLNNLTVKGRAYKVSE